MGFYQSARKRLRWFFKFIYRINIVGAENEPAEAPFIVCSNHVSMTDVIVLGVAFEHQLHYMAKAELFKIPLLRGLIRTLGAFPVKRGAADVSSLKTSINLLEGGEVVALFPQGTRYMRTDPRTTEPKSGVGLIAYRSGATVVPAYIEMKNNKHLIFRKHTVRIGSPISQEELAFTGGTKSEYERAARIIFDHITEMSPEARSEADGN